MWVSGGCQDVRMGCNFSRPSEVVPIVLNGGPMWRFSTNSVRGEACLTIVHFNDVYNIEEREKEPVGGAARFKSKLDSLQDLHPLVLFSGDALNPSNSESNCHQPMVVC